ncbi:MAG: hypothetical protein HYV02_01145 [Deltaproteobacteria bacterium]|nr:hypothetical protein [Deltaproteobacteria bacterium]
MATLVGGCKDPRELYVMAGIVGSVALWQGISRFRARASAHANAPQPAYPLSSFLGPEVPPEKNWARGDLANTIAEQAARTGIAMVCGFLRSGKTSLVHGVRTTLAKQGYVDLGSIDFRGDKNPMQQLCRGIRSSLWHLPREFLEEVRRTLPNDGATLQRLDALLETLALRGVISLAELGAIERAETLTWLRSAATGLAHLVVILDAPYRPDIATAFHDVPTYWTRNLTRAEMGQFLRAIAQRDTRGTSLWTSARMDRIWELTGGHLYLTNILLTTFYKRVPPKTQKQRRLDAALAAAADDVLTLNTADDRWLPLAVACVLSGLTVAHCRLLQQLSQQPGTLDDAQVATLYPFLQMGWIERDSQGHRICGEIVRQVFAHMDIAHFSPTEDWLSEHHRQQFPQRPARPS